MRRFLALARVVATASAREAAPVFVPTYFGLGIVAAIIFGPNGMHAADVTRVALTEPKASIALWGAWLLLTTPIARAALFVPETFVLRSMPIPRWHFVLLTGLQLAVVELLWIALWARGAGPLGAIAAGAAAVGAHGLIVARPSRALELAAAVALALAIGASASLPLLLAAAVLAAPVGVSAAFRRAPERDARVRRAPLPSALPTALAVTHLITVRRGDAAVFGRAFLLTALGGLTTPLIARGYDVTAPSSMSTLSLSVATGTLLIATAGIASAVLRAERHARWLLDSSATSGGERVLAAALATAASGAFFGLLHGALMSFIAGATPTLAVRLLGLGGLLGGVIGVLAAWHARRADREGPRKGGGSIARFVALGGASIVALSVLGEPALLILAAVVVLLAVRSSRDAAALPEPLCARRGASSSQARGAA